MRVLNDNQMLARKKNQIFINIHCCKVLLNDWSQKKPIVKKCDKWGFQTQDNVVNNLLIILCDI